MNWLVWVIMIGISLIIAIVAYYFMFGLCESDGFSTMCAVFTFFGVLIWLYEQQDK